MYLAAACLWSMRREDSLTRTLVGVWVKKKSLLVVIGRCNEAWPLSEIRTAFSCLDFYYSADELCSARLPKSDFHFIMALYLKPGGDVSAPSHLAQF